MFQWPRKILHILYVYMYYLTLVTLSMLRGSKEMGKWLNDIIIDSSMQLIKSPFSHIGGLGHAYMQQTRSSKQKQKNYCKL